jgi:hypothetical protein
MHAAGLVSENTSTKVYQKDGAFYRHSSAGPPLLQRAIRFEFTALMFPERICGLGVRTQLERRPTWVGGARPQTEGAGQHVDLQRAYECSILIKGGHRSVEKFERRHGGPPE